MDKSDYIFVLETNGMTLGNDPSFAKELSRFNNLHVRVSIKGCTPKEYNTLTGAASWSYELPYKALGYLIQEGVSCNACLMVSFSNPATISQAELRLSKIRPGLLKSLEREHITLFPKVASRLNKEQLTPNTIRHRGEKIQLKKEKHYV